MPPWKLIKRLIKEIPKLDQFCLGKCPDVIVGAEPEDGQDELEEPVHHAEHDETESVDMESYMHLCYGYKELQF